MKRQIHPGDHFGRLTVTAILGRGRVQVLCSCGTRREVWASNLLAGTTASCGCLRGTHRSYLASTGCALAEHWH